MRTFSKQDPLQKRLATHSSILAWRIPWTEEPDRLQFVGSQRVGHERLMPSLNFSTDDSNSLKLNSLKALTSHEEKKKKVMKRKNVMQIFPF